MPKPAQLDEIDEARRVLGMLDAVNDPEEYKEIFGISNNDIDKYRELVSDRQINKPKFYEN